MRSLIGRLSIAWLITATLAGCASGQTGSPDCVPAKSCVCDPLYGAGTQLRVRVLGYRDGRLTAQIEEVFASQFGDNGLQVGDQIGGELPSALPCEPEAPADTPEDSEQFVLFNPGFDNGDRNLSDGHFAWAIPWTASLSFGAMHDLPRDELSVLATDSSCWQRFPADDPLPCDDTSSVTCAAAPAHSESSGCWLLAGAAVAGCAAHRRRARRLS